MKRYRDLIVWQKSVALVTLVYKLLKVFPDEEKYDFTLQRKRNSVSVSSNSAEGYGINSAKAYIRFLNISRGSLYKMQTQFQIALNLDFVKEKDLDKIKSLSTEIEKILHSLISKLNNNPFLTHA